MKACMLAPTIVDTFANVLHWNHSLRSQARRQFEVYFHFQLGDVSV